VGIHRDAPAVRVIDDEMAIATRLPPEHLEITDDARLAERVVVGAAGRGESTGACQLV
jgi:hypothetical protein